VGLYRFLVIAWFVGCVLACVHGLFKKEFVSGCYIFYFFFVVVGEGV